MNDIALQIAELMKSTGKNASKMTHGLKELGNGDMEQGLVMIGKYFEKERMFAVSSALSKGRIQGGLVVGGVTLSIGAVGAIICLTHRIKEKKKLDAEGEYILKTLKNASDESEYVTSDSDG